MKTELEKLYKKESELLYQINGIARWSGLGFCESQLNELEKVREQITVLRDKK
tara:strand:+ start:2312 stop:2470 length:159 start_codon:yes stop_codon:yes gene_type:complete